MTTRHWVLLTLTAISLTASGCAGRTPAPTVTPTPMPVVPVTAMLTPTFTLGPAPTEAPRPTPSPSPSVSPSPPPTDTPIPPSETPVPPTESPPTEAPVQPTDTPVPAPAGFVPAPPPGREFASLDDFWGGAAEWMLEVFDVGLPVGESDTVHVGDTEFWSYLHASHQSAGVVDSCGDPAPFPGCITLWKSHDGGRHFALETPVCLFTCATCPCDPGRDHTHQQQYPRVFFDADRAYMVYEWGAGTLMRTSTDGIQWSSEAHVAGTGAWHIELGPCTEAEAVGEHPHIYSELEFDCLVGAPPGIYIEGNTLYVFVGLGRAPGHMGCYLGDKLAGTAGLRKCASNPLFGAESGYGPTDVLGAEANAYFEFRTVSSADVVRIGDHYYMAYEGVRGPSDPTVVDNQFGLGFARSVGPAIDGPWERFPSNPVIMDLANNWGIGHGDILIVGPATYLYTASSATTRGRYVLVRR